MLDNQPRDSVLDSKSQQKKYLFFPRHYNRIKLVDILVIHVQYPNGMGWLDGQRVNLAQASFTDWVGSVIEPLLWLKIICGHYVAIM